MCLNKSSLGIADAADVVLVGQLALYSRLANSLALDSVASSVINHPEGVAFRSDRGDTLHALPVAFIFHLADDLLVEVSYFSDSFRCHAGKDRMLGRVTAPVELLPVGEHVRIDVHCTDPVAQRVRVGEDQLAARAWIARFRPAVVKVEHEHLR